MTKWMKIFVRVMDGEKDISSPFYEAGIISSVFVTDKDNHGDKIGCLMFWCSITNKGAIF